LVLMQTYALRYFTKESSLRKNPAQNMIADDRS
jgi:hypothetical protein